MCALCNVVVLIAHPLTTHQLLHYTEFNIVTVYHCRIQLCSKCVTTDGFCRQSKVQCGFFRTSLVYGYAEIGRCIGCRKERARCQLEVANIETPLIVTTFIVNCQTICAVFRYSNFVRELCLRFRNDYWLADFRIGCRIVTFAIGNLHHLLILSCKRIVSLERNGVESVGFQFKRWRHKPIVCCTLRIVARLCASLPVVSQSPIPCLVVVVGIYCCKVIERLLVVETLLERWRERIADNDSVRCNTLALAVARFRCNNKAILL